MTDVGATGATPFLNSALKAAGLLGQPPKRVLSHYCKPETFEKIVASKSLSATDIADMKDGEEYKFGMELVRETLRRLIDSDFADVVVRMEDVLQRRADHSIHASCFSDDDDLPSQWRDYAEKGTGYAIGIDLSRLRDGQRVVQPVTYGSDAAVTRFNRSIDWALRARRQTRHDFDAERSRVGIGTSLALTLSIGIAAAKRPGYAPEQEWRWITWPRPAQTADSIVDGKHVIALPLPRHVGRDEMRIAVVRCGPRSERRHAEEVLSAANIRTRIIPSGVDPDSVG